MTVPWMRSVASSRSRSGRSSPRSTPRRTTVRTTSRTGSITSLMTAACSSGSLTASLISLGAMRGRAVCATRDTWPRWKAAKSPASDPVSSGGPGGRSSETASITSSSFEGQRL